jgi:RNA polymerase sigma-70 factor (ECF subfamily)
MRPQDWDWGSAHARCLAEARRILRSQAAAEEAVQEAFLRAWRRRGDCRNPESPLPWLLQITRNEALRLARRTGRPDPAPEEVLRDPGADPLENLLERIDLQREVARLADEDRRLLWMRYGDDLTQPRLAELLEIPEGTVKVRLHRLRERLRLALEIKAKDS